MFLPQGKFTNRKGNLPTAREIYQPQGKLKTQGLIYLPQG
jgi:hypothetical protein